MNSFKVQRCTGIETDPNKDPLTKDLHELGLKHGAVMVVMALRPGKNPQAMVISPDPVPADKTARALAQAGDFLLDASEAVSKYAEEQEG